MISFSVRLLRAAAATLLLGAIAAGCSRRLDSGGAGNVRVALQIPPGGPAVSSVHWRILSASSTVVKQGDIDTSNINATASVDTSCPAGSGDTITLTATASDGSPCTGSSAPFNVIAGGQVMVGVLLVCGGGTPMQPNGSVTVGTTIVAGDNCPLLTQWQASPLQTTSGANISVAATATDADPGETLSYSWTATSGSFASATAAATTYTCSSIGPQTLTVTVTDNHFPAPCATAMSLPVNCTGPGECGDLIIQPGEQCDPPNGTNCNAQCQHVVFCGDGIIEPPETCDPPHAPTCPANCQSAECGDGIIQQGETCDPPGPLPDGTICLATCQIAGCLGPGDNACSICEKADVADCPASLNVVPGSTCGWGCASFPNGSPAQLHCQALYTCLRTSGCMAGDDFTPCLCGTLTAGQCVASGPPADAPCAAQYAAAAADTPSLGPLINLTSNPSSPVGIADNQAVCAVDSALTSGCVCP